MNTDRFESLYRENVRVVNAYASARLGRDAGEDVTAEVFHAAVAAYRSGKEDTVTPSWLMAVTRNKVIDRWRAAGRRKAKAHLVEAQVGDTATFPAGWAHDDRRDAVFDALDGLNPRHRMLLILHHVDGMPIVEMADALQQSSEAIESALVRARSAFRRVYRDHRGEERRT
ncbi:MAG: sigma-70 family RNA polymerase sigma factor [Actinomycetota bacterium]